MIYFRCDYVRDVQFKGIGAMTSFIHQYRTIKSTTLKLFIN